MSMFARLFLLIGLVSGVSLGVVAGLLWRNSLELESQLRAENTRAGDKVLKNGTELLENNLQNTHRMIVREKARKVEAYFSSIADAVQLQSTLIRQFLPDAGNVAQAPPLFEGNQLTKYARSNLHQSPTLVGVQPYAMFHLAPGVPMSAVGPAMNRLRRLGGFFARTQHGLSGCDSSYFGSEQGFILGYPGGMSFFKPSYDPRQRPWYKEAMQHGGLIWDVGQDRNGSLFLTCAQPVTLSSNPRPVGVAAIDMNLVKVLRELFNVESLHFSRAILVDSSGHVRVSGSSHKGRPLFDRNVVKQPHVSQLPGFAQAYAQSHAHLSQNSGIFPNGPAMIQAGNTFLYIYSTVSFSGAGAGGLHAKAAKDDWRYIVQVPVAPLLAPIHRMARDMGHSTQDIAQAIHNRTSQSAAIVLVLIGATLLAALSVAYFAARATSRPLMQMARVARGVGEGNLEQQALESSGGEIGELGRAINAMISGLRQRNLLKETFGRYVAPSVADQLLREGNIQLGVSSASSRSSSRIWKASPRCPKSRRPKP